MTQTPNLKLPYIMPGQALKYITHNEALLRLDELVQLTAISQQSSPPMATEIGESYIVESGASGDWDGFDGFIARRIRGEKWDMIEPSTGWVCFLESVQMLYVYYDSDWHSTQTSSESVSYLGVNATADFVNRLAVKSEAALFDHAGMGHVLKINKAESVDTASLQFQSAYQSYGEIGLIGDQDLGVKVSADGSTWKDSIRFEPDTGHTRCQNLYSGDVYLLNDTAKTITPPKSGGFLMIMIDNDLYPQLSHAAVLAYDVGVSPNLLIIGGGNKLRVVNSEVLTGSSGPEGFTTLSCLDGNLMVENRYGTHQLFRYTFLG